MSEVRQLAGHHYRYDPGDAAAPVLLALHGTGGDENDLVPFARLISPESAVVSPRGNVRENGMPRFFRRLAEGVFDMEDLRLRTAELGTFLRQAAAAHGFALDRVIALGFSNGANVAASLMLSEPDCLRHGVLLRAMVPFEPRTVPQLGSSSALISAGRADPLVPRANAERLVQLLEAGGASVELRWQEAGHALVQGDVADARDYVTRLRAQFESAAATR